MVRKQGGLLNVSFAANENVVKKCLDKIKEVEPNSRAEKLYHITIKTDPNVEFVMDGFEYTTDELGYFSSIPINGTNTVEIRDIHFKNSVNKCVLCFIY